MNRRRFLVGLASAALAPAVMTKWLAREGTWRRSRYPTYGTTLQLSDDHGVWHTIESVKEIDRELARSILKGEEKHWSIVWDPE